MQTFPVHHTLIWPNDSLVVTRHKEIRGEIIHLEKQDLYPCCVTKEPLIHLVRSRAEEEVRHRGSVLETQGNVSVQGL